MVADLFLNGSKILFFTAYPMAKDNFLEQVKGNESKINYVTDEDKIDINAQAIIIESGNEKLFLESLNKIKDIEERVVFIKNIEVFSDIVFDSCLKLSKIIFSGDIDKCSASIQKNLLNKKYETIIVFSKPQIPFKFDVPILEKYTGYLWNNEKKGFVQVLK